MFPPPPGPTAHDAGTARWRHYDQIILALPGVRRLVLVVRGRPAGRAHPRKDWQVSNDTNLTEAVLDISGRWAAAERYGDTEMLAVLLTDDFVGVGPRGFTLTKQGWMDRHSSGALRHEEFSWGNVQVRLYGDAAIAVGVTESKGSWAGQPITSKARVTQVFVRANGSWAIAGMHMSPTGGIPPVAAVRNAASLLPAYSGSGAAKVRRYLIRLRDLVR